MGYPILKLTQTIFFKPNQTDNISLTPNYKLNDFDDFITSSCFMGLSFWQKIITPLIYCVYMLIFIRQYYFSSKMLFFICFSSTYLTQDKKHRAKEINFCYIS